jgi:ergothioneine biosynthesis protein EgtB
MMTRKELIKAFQHTRKISEEICRPLETEDYVIQASDDVSPPKWHLGHTTWFFETFLLKPNTPDFKPHHPLYNYLFNSYYEAIGNRWERPKRGLLSRPIVREVYQYREAIDQKMLSFLEKADDTTWSNIESLVDLGIHHEQQHQELLYMDIKSILALNPIKPVYRKRNPELDLNKSPIPSLRFIGFEGGITEIGHSGSGFGFDNEFPRHKVLLQDYSIANRLVTIGEYLEFMKDGGYTNPLLWLSDGWYAINQNHWESPMYWEKQDGQWMIMTLSGLRSLDLNEPVSHVSFYEADAFARWSGKRLPTEAEWEHAAIVSNAAISSGNFADDGVFHPLPAWLTEDSRIQLHQMYGDLWQWTASAYLPYPGFKPAEGAVGEYNGKFMSNQMVLRGGACVTPRNHIRASYRNFFQPDKRWQFSGIRLASDGKQS